MRQESGLQRTIAAYLDFIQSPKTGELASEVRTEILIRLCDSLAQQVHFGQGVFHEGPTPPERTDDNDLYQRITANFPDLHAYGTALSIAPVVTAENIGIGDPIDDLTDIALDLMDVQAVCSLQNDDAGQYNFVERFRLHWGFHLRELQLYLHCLAHGF